LGLQSKQSKGAEVACSSLYRQVLVFKQKILNFTRNVFLRIAESQTVNSIHKFKVEGISGEEIDFA